MQAGTLCGFVEYLRLATEAYAECLFVVLGSRVTTHSNDLKANNSKTKHDVGQSCNQVFFFFEKKTIPKEKTASWSLTRSGSDLSLTWACDVSQDRPQSRTLRQRSFSQQVHPEDMELASVGVPKSSSWAVPDGEAARGACTSQRRTLLPANGNDWLDHMALWQNHRWNPHRLARTWYKHPCMVAESAWIEVHWSQPVVSLHTNFQRLWIVLVAPPT